MIFQRDENGPEAIYRMTGVPKTGAHSIHHPQFKRMIPKKKNHPTQAGTVLNTNEPESVRGVTKREFLRLCGSGLCSLLATDLFGCDGVARAEGAVKGLIRPKLSPYFTAEGGGDIQCELCPRRCIVPDGQRGFCRVRENRGGKYYSLVYGSPCAIQLEPIEKKPFLHVLPSTTSLSIATAGCNFHCLFCQNWEISQASPEDVYAYEVPPELVVEKAKQMGARSIAYTYVEPTVFYEYMLDVGELARKEGLLSVIHSNGFISKEPLRRLCKVLDAAQIDLKAFTQTFYRELCDGDLDPVLETLKILRQENIHLEITNLIIPTKNDEMSQVREMCLWILRHLGPDVPVHFSRFYPLYKLRKLPSTPVSILEKAREIGLSSGLQYVYVGNVPAHRAWNTFCPHCKKMLIHRTGYMVKEMHLNEGSCRFCGKPIPGIWT